LPFLTVACARARMPLLVVGVVLVLVGDRVGTALVWVGLGCMLLGLATYFRLVPAHGSARLILPPVSGSWVAVNSPADRVPSHGILAYGQSHAVDLVHVPTTGPEAGRRPGEPAGGSWHPRPESFSGFGRPVLAVADGEVVRVRSWQPDARAFLGRLGIVVFMLLAALRELGGAGAMLGNHVIIKIAPGTYAIVAHLRRGSVKVRRGERVSAGQVIAECGNTGNTTEPHVHVQLSDSSHPAFAAGVPMAFRLSEDVTGVPANGELLPHDPGGDVGA
jgi:Peptidase family M23